MEQTVIKRTCDFCGGKQEFPAQVADISADQQKPLEGWITLVRLFLVRGQLQPVQLHVCKDSCAINAIQMGQVDLPQQVKDMLAQDAKMQQIFDKKLAAARKHAFIPKQNPNDANGEPVCSVENCGLTAMAHCEA